MTEPFHTIELSDRNYEREGLRTLTVKSRALGRRADMTVWVPEALRVSGLLILLHGVWGSHWVWTLKGGVHRTAQRLVEMGEIAPMVIAMPSDGLQRDGSGYLTWPHAEDVERWIVDEVPNAAQLAAPALTVDAPVAIGGLSMGGYGALRLGAKYADRFCGISAHSSITHASEFAHFIEEPLSDYQGVGSSEDLSVLHWLRNAGSRLPALRFDCGVKDTLIEANRALNQELRRAEILHDYFEYPGGHEWSYWQEHIVQTLRFADRQFQARGHV